MNQDIPYSLWNLKDLYQIHKSPPLKTKLGHINPIYILLTFHFTEIHVNIFPQLRTVLPSGLIPSSLPTKDCVREPDFQCQANLHTSTFSTRYLQHSRDIQIFVINHLFSKLFKSRCFKGLPGFQQKFIIFSVQFLIYINPSFVSQNTCSRWNELQNLKYI